MPPLRLQGHTVNVYQTANPAGSLDQFPLSELTYGMATCGERAVGFDVQYAEAASAWVEKISRLCSLDLSLDDYEDTRSWVDLELMFGEERMARVTSEDERLLEVINAGSLDFITADPDESSLDKLKRTVSQIWQFIKEKAALAEAKAREMGLEIQNWAKEQNWGLISGWVVAAVGVVILVWLSLLAPLGFGAFGIVAGSFAAAIQSLVYGAAVASGSLFAVGQSIGMGGSAVLAMNLQVTAVVFLVLGGLLIWHFSTAV